jgi:hypothetical protein
LRSAAVRGNIIGNLLLAFVEVTHPGAFDSTNVNEHVSPAVDRLDEPETFRSVEPLMRQAFCLRVRNNARLVGMAACFRRPPS